MAAPLLLLQNIKLAIGSTDLLDGAELSVGAGERLCLVGRNGSGKSTLLKVAAGLIQPDGGERFAQPGATIRYLPQEPDLSGFATVTDYVEAGLISGEDPTRARHLLRELGLTGDENPSTLSGGEARRAALARVLAPSPDILLLDEPTSSLDLITEKTVKDILLSLKGKTTIVVIAHRLSTVRNADQVIYMDRGKIIARGTFEEVRANVIDFDKQAKLMGL